MRRVIVITALALGVLAAPIAPAPAQMLGRSLYFAEGTTRAGFIELLSFLNTAASPISISLEYQFADGSPSVTRQVAVEARTLAFVFPADDPAIGVGRDISVVATSSSYFTGARLMDIDVSFDGSGPVTGTTALSGIDRPGLDWHLAEGSTLAGFQEYVTIQNPSAQDAQITLTYGLEAAPSQTSSTIVPAASRATIDVRAEVGAGRTGVSVRVESTNGVPVLVERPFYFSRDLAGTGNVDDGGHVAPGVLPQPSWFFAEGNLLDGWHEFLTLYNPTAAAQEVTVDYLLEGATPRQKVYAVPAGARRTVQVYTDAPNEGIGRAATTAPSKGVSMQVTAPDQVVAERPLYAQASIETEVNDGHVSPGAVATQDCVEFAYGTTEGTDTTFVTLANPGATAVDVAVGLYPAPGAGPVTTADRTIAPGSRLTIDLRDVLDETAFGIDVVARAGGRFVAEVPIYDSFGGDTGAAILQPTNCF